MLSPVLAGSDRVTFLELFPRLSPFPKIIKTKLEHVSQSTGKKRVDDNTSMVERVLS